MKYRLVSFITLLGLLACGCEKSPDGKQVPVVEVGTIGSNPDSLTAIVKVEVPTPCWEYAYAIDEWSGNECRIAVYATKTTEEPCIQMVGSIEAVVRVALDGQSNVVAHFIGKDGQEITRQIQVLPEGFLEQE